MYAADLDLALRLANRADSITGKRFRSADLQIQDKPDMTPVTDADVAVERIVRDILEIERPEDTVLGEEFGGERAHTGRQWVIDPIDGTKNYVRGVPVWATLIALFDEGAPVVGLVSAPGLSRRWWASAGQGAYSTFEGGLPRELRVSGVSDVSAASLSFSSLSGWCERGTRDRLIAFTDEVWRVRGYGDFLSYCLVAEGAVDIAAEPEVSLWDLAALDVIVREAGGRFTSLEGTPGPDGGSALATNGLLHAAALDRIGG